jgi:arylformamidase
MSGLFDVNQSIANTGVIAYYGTNSVELANRSPVNRISYASTPTFFTVAELDPVFIASSVLKLASVFATINGSIPPLAWLAGHNHLSPAVSIGCAGDELGGAFIHALRTVMR